MVFSLKVLPVQACNVFTMQNTALYCGKASVTKIKEINISFLKGSLQINTKFLNGHYINVPSYI